MCRGLWLAWQQPKPYGGGGEPSPGMTFAFRFRMWAISVLECVLLLCVEFMLGGPCYDEGRSRLGLRKAVRGPLFAP